MTPMHHLQAACPLTAWNGQAACCHHCGTPITGRRKTWCSDKCRRTFERNHIWNKARTAAKRRDKRTCVQCGQTHNLEINHITPLIGAGYKPSCAHHQTNLETLCHNCHVKVTRSQKQARKQQKP